METIAFTAVLACHQPFPTGALAGHRPRPTAALAGHPALPLRWPGLAARTSVSVE
ncbi:MAG TPA: hypothetical protein VIP48_16055 [Streptosporangiaceae bacterium]